VDGRWEHWDDVDWLHELLDELRKADSLRPLTTLDMTPPPAFWASVDSALHEAFGDIDEDHHDDFAATALLNLQTPGLEGLTVVFPGLMADSVATLQKLGIHVAAPPSTLADLLSGHAVSLTKHFVDTVIGGREAFEEFERILKVADRPLKLLPPALPLDYAVYTALGDRR
jgi:hypothetical protein